MLGGLAIGCVTAAAMAASVAAFAHEDGSAHPLVERAATPQIQERVSTAPARDLDCTFFDSQAFNRPDDHFLAQMARMCAMLSQYKEAVIEANTRRFLAAQERERASAGNRVAPMATAGDSSKYLIAREIGLIDAMKADGTAGQPAGE